MAETLEPKAARGDEVNDFDRLEPKFALAVQYWKGLYEREKARADALAAMSWQPARIEALENALAPFAKIEAPSNAEPSTRLATTLYCNDQVTWHSVKKARAVLQGRCPDCWRLLSFTGPPNNPCKACSPPLPTNRETLSASAESGDGKLPIST